MTRKQFEKLINRAEIKLINKRYDGTIWYRGVCSVLCSDLWRDNLYCDFNDRFRPTRKHSEYWIGKLTKKNVQKRKDFLRLFEQVALTEKLYLRY